jgi:hypothetical protein
VRWLTRLVSRDVRNLWVLLDAEKGGHRAAIRRIGVMGAEALELHVALHQMEEIATEDWSRTDRYRLAWLSASRRAERRSNEIAVLKRQVVSVRARSAEAHTSSADTIVGLKVALAEARALAQALAGADLQDLHRHSANRLGAENADLREQVDALKRKYEGVPS